jgi:hypothetical protein
MTSYLTSYYTLGSTSTETILTTASFRDISGCYMSVLVFNSLGTTHFEYSAKGPMVVYVLTESSLTDWLSVLWTGGQCSASTPTIYERSILSQSYPVSGSFDLSLPSGNTYGIVLIAFPSETSPAIQLSIGPVLLAQTTTATTSIPVTSTATSARTLMFISTLELPLIHTYGSWMTAIIVGALVVAIVFFVVRRTRHARKRRKHR